MVCYRLRQLDTDGTSTYSPVRSVAIPTQRPEFTLYPNSARESLRTSAFASTGTAQTTTLTVGLSYAKAGAVAFNLVSSGSAFTPPPITTTLAAGQTTVAMPLGFDGTSTLTSEAITVSAGGWLFGLVHGRRYHWGNSRQCASATT